jgi:hypothetical protein
VDENQFPGAQKTFIGMVFMLSFCSLARQVIIQCSGNIFIAISVQCVNMQTMNITAEILPEGILVAQLQPPVFQTRNGRKTGKLLELVGFLR